MNDKQRLQFLLQTQRIHNWLQRTKLTPDEFITFHRSQLDQLITPLMPKKHKNIWRKWEDLSEKQRTKIIKRLRRGEKSNFTKADAAAMRLLPSAERNIDSEVYKSRKHKGKNYRPHLPVLGEFGYATRLHRAWADKEGTPAERINDQRQGEFKRIIRGQLKHRGGDINIEFIPNLHPNDVEITHNDDDSALSLIIDRAAVKFSKILSDTILSAKLYIQDSEIIEVYYCAVLVHKSSPSVEYCYIGRAKQLFNDKFDPGTILNKPHYYHLPTKRYTTAKGALQAARRLYAQSAARLIREDGRL